MIYALPIDPKRNESRVLVDIAIGEGFKLQYIVHYARLLRYMFCNRARIDFVHYYSTMLMFIGPWLSLCVGLPSLVTVTGFGRVFSNSSFKYLLLRPLYRMLFSFSVRLSRGILFQNYTDLQTISERLPLYRDKMFYIGSAVDIPSCEEKDFSVSRLRVLLVTRLLPDKGIDDFLTVAKHLNNDSLEFILVGPPSVGLDDLLKRVMCAASQGIVTYLGELDASSTQKQFQGAHIFFFPSAYGEGMARVLLEAGFARVCPIAYDIPPNRDLIIEGRGFLTSVGDIDQVIQIIAYLHKNRDKLEQVARTYQSFVVENYNMTTFARRQDHILTQLFGKKIG